MSFLAQVSGSDFTAPVTGIGVVGVIGFFMKWLMNVAITKLDANQAAMQAIAERNMATMQTIAEKTLASNRSMEKSIDFNSRATLMLGIAQSDMKNEIHQRLKGCPLLDKHAERSNTALDQEFRASLTELEKKEATRRQVREEAGE